MHFGQKAQGLFKVVNIRSQTTEIQSRYLSEVFRTKKPKNLDTFILTQCQSAALIAPIPKIFVINVANRPIYSCVLSCLAMDASEAGGDLALIQTSQLFSCKCKLVSITTT